VQSLHEKLTSALAGGYVVVRELGSGGMATVYLADDLRHRRKVAIKVLRPDLALSLGADRFLREIEIAAQLQHPNILPLLDSGSANGLLYYVMPYVEGESLRERLARDGELPVPEAVRILCEVADALSLAHSRGVIHRDIKPGNVLLSGRHALLADFGIARAVSEAAGEQALTTAGVALGTPSYMAPEQAAADPHIDHRADIYAVGVLAYELLTGHPPFTGASSQTILMAHMTQTPVPLRYDRPGIPPLLDQAVLRCLAKRPADRWQSAAELLSTLETMTTPSGETTPTSSRPAVAVRRTVPIVVGVTAGVVLLAATGAILLQRDHRPPITLGRTQQITNAAGLELDPALSPDGKLIAYAAGPLLETHIYVRQIAGGRPVDVTQGLAGSHRWPRWSPDGTQLLFITTFQDTTFINITPSLGGPTRRLAGAPVAGGGIASAAWSPDGRRIAYDSSNTIALQSSSGGNATTLVASAGDLSSLSWSPDGSRIAFVNGNSAFVSGSSFGNIAPSAVHVVSVNGGPSVAVVSGEFLNMSPVWSSDGRALLFLSNREGGRDLYQVDLSRSGEPAGRPKRITTGLNAHSIAMSANGKALVYSALTLQANVWSIRQPLRGSVSVGQAEPITHGNQVVEAMNVSPDGQWLAFDSDQSGNADIYRMPLRGGETEQLTTDPMDDFAPAWSPNGDEIAFHSFRNGSRDLFVMPASGGAAQQVTSGPAEDRFSRWSPDGNRLAFQRQGQIYVVERQEQTRAWGTPRSLGQAGTRPIWSADGRRILFVVAGTIRGVSASGGEARIVYQAKDPLRDPRPRGLRLTATGETIVFKAEDNGGKASFWSIPVTGGTPRPLVRFDVPGRDSFRADFDVWGNRIYFTMANHQSDIYMVELQQE
jgi:eukaryotic-like serine/threonine-protein kinase